MRSAHLRVYVCLLVLTALVPVAPNAVAGDKNEGAKEATPPTKMIRTLDLSKFDVPIIKTFQKAWASAHHGRDSTERVVLLFKLVTGGYQTRLLPPTNEHGQSTFTMPSHALAVFHTHPIRCSPQPSLEDRQIADKYGVLMFTMTTLGMYVYDPHTKKTSLVMYGVEWLEPANWTSSLAEKMASISPAFKTDSSQISSR